MSMSELKLWFLDVGHGDCCYIELPNGARMMIDCGGGDNNWPSKLLTHYNVTKSLSPVPLPTPTGAYGLDSLVITHPHGDHISDIAAIHDSIGFQLLTGGYRPFIDKIADSSIDFKKRGQQAAKKFKEVVKGYCGEYDANNDRVALAKLASACHVEKARFIDYEDGIDLNDISYLVSISYSGQKILFAGDLTASAIGKILKSNKAQKFKDFVKGTTVLKVAHHGRENGCSEELFQLFGSKPVLCVASDEVLNDRNQGTSNIQWYTARTSDVKISINGAMESRKVLTTRKDKDIYLQIPASGNVAVLTNVFKEVRQKLL
jgi:beta-lactamase superfamily II metal-dependent hydrolase